MDKLALPKGASPPVSPAGLSPGRPSKAEPGPAPNFDRVLKAKKAEAEEKQSVLAAAVLQPGGAPNPAQPPDPPPTAESGKSGPDKMNGVSPTGTLTTAGSIDQTKADQAADQTQKTEGFGKALTEATAQAALEAGNASAGEAHEGMLATPEGQVKLARNDQQTQQTAAATTGVTFLEGMGPDGMAQGAVSVQNSDAKLADLGSIPVEKAVTEKAADPTPADVGAVKAVAAQQPQEAVKQTEAARKAAEVEVKVQKAAKTEEAAVSSSTKPAESTPSMAAQTAQATQVEIGKTQPANQQSLARPENQPVPPTQQIWEGIEATIRQGRSSMRIQLSPQELGGIDIRLVSNAHGMSVTVIAEQASTGRLLEGQIQQLRQSLSDAGIQLTNLNISQQDASGQPGLNNQGYGQQPQQAGQYHRMKPETESEPPEALSAALRGIRTGRGVDYRV